MLLCLAIRNKSQFRMVTQLSAYKLNLSAMVKAMPIFSLCLTITRFIKILELVLK